MITANFLVEWAIRSSLLIVSAALLLWLLRVKDPSIRLAACIAAVCGSLSMPFLTAAFPKLPVSIMPAPISTTALTAPSHVAPSGDLPLHKPQSRASSRPADWASIAVGSYGFIAGALLLRLGMGILFARNLRLQSRATDLTTDRAEIRESERVTSPVTIGLTRAVIVLPADWREWSQVRLHAVLAHEASHVRRKDPAVQILSAMHRALLWHSPLSWMLHRRVVRLAEDVSDDAAVAATSDRTSYAEMLLEFMQRGVRVSWQGVSMARYGRADDRIHRILNGTILSTGITRGAVAAIFTLAIPLAYVTAVAIPAPAVRSASALGAVPSTEAVTPTNTHTAAPVAELALAQKPAVPSAANRHSGASVRKYIIVLGDTESGSWDSLDSVTPEGLRARFGNRFVWFRQGGSEYTITDDGVLRDIERAMEPQKKVNAQQDQVNRLQSTVNNLQDQVNSKQDDVNGVQGKVNVLQEKVNAAQATINKRQHLLNSIQDTSSREGKDAAIRKVETLLKELRTSSDVASQDDVNHLQDQVNTEQDRVNKLQHEVSLQQDRVNAEQNKLNREQGKVNAVQTEVSEEFHKRIQEIFESALRRGLTKVGN